MSRVVVSQQVVVSRVRTLHGTQTYRSNKIGILIVIGSSILWPHHLLVGRLAWTLLVVPGRALQHDCFLGTHCTVVVSRFLTLTAAAIIVSSRWREQEVVSHHQSATEGRRPRERSEPDGWIR
jgi:hypothetical protein